MFRLAMATHCIGKVHAEKSAGFYLNGWGSSEDMNIRVEFDKDSRAGVPKIVPTTNSESRNRGYPSIYLICF